MNAAINQPSILTLRLGQSDQADHQLRGSSSGLVWERYMSNDPSALYDRS